MAKKTRKPNLPQATLERARRELYTAGSEQVTAPPAQSDVKSAQPTAQRSPALKTKLGAPVDLRQEYAYVLTDLQNMAMLAAALGAILIVLSFFL
ncbi:MAG: hypothetical protein JW966_15795 [Anaerolineae bacterium]|nr:hypothetical protein [Anaerolineae bacterium]